MRLPLRASRGIALSVRIPRQPAGACSQALQPDWPDPGSGAECGRAPPGPTGLGRHPVGRQRAFFYDYFVARLEEMARQTPASSILQSSARIISIA